MSETQLYQLGGSGFAIAVALMLIQFLMSLVKNHISHNTKALEAMVAALTAHTTMLERTIHLVEQHVLINRRDE
tara:strand:+ start:331 stop:552 length:222 start_codon:yes stop_codon:yes gene_type:complete